MSIDTSTFGSPGWWLRILAERMAARNISLDTLKRYLDGHAPLPEGASDLKEAYRDFQRKARTNFGQRIVEAPVSRMTVAGFRVGDASELSKDCDRIWSFNELDTFAGDVHFDMLGMRNGYAIVGPPGPDGIPVITRENPFLMIVDPDPMRPTKARAALKMYRDPDRAMDYAYLYLPGAVYVAQRSNGTADTPSMVLPTVGGFEWVPDMAPMRWPRGFEDVVPVVRFHNLKGLGEFESHTDTLRRIDYMMLQRLVITALQAFRQRAARGNMPEIQIDPLTQQPKLTDDGEPIPVDYEAIFRPGIGKTWVLPEGVELWESGSTDITPILAAVKDDVRLLAMQTNTPITMLYPEGANQSAEGAKNVDSEFVFKVEDRIKRASYGWNQVMSLALRFQGSAVSVLDMETLWAPAERFTLSERFDALGKAVASGIPLAFAAEKIGQFSPEEVEEMQQQRLADALTAGFSSQAAAVTANGAQ